ncbi:hypothetical protein TYRP_007843 [Tyrophagus putrescentiae]|nr:hypothetical protein TYRP_007843 [Tyrophagus putrescentiae]
MGNDWDEDWDEEDDWEGDEDDREEEEDVEDAVIIGVDDVHRHRRVVDVPLVDSASVSSSCSGVPVIDSVNIHYRHVAVHPTCAAVSGRLVAVVVDRLRGGEVAAVHRRVHRLNRGGVILLRGIRGHQGCLTKELLEVHGGGGVLWVPNFAASDSLKITADEVIGAGASH